MAWSKNGNSAKGDSAGAGSSQAVTVTSTTAGDTLWVYAVCGTDRTATISIADNGATHATWVSLLNVYDATLAVTRAVWAAYNCPAGITAITVSYGASVSPRCTIFQPWSGGTATAFADQYPASQTQTSATPASLQVSPTQDNELVIGTALGPTNAISQHTLLALGFFSTGIQAVFEYVIQTTKAAVTPDFTCTSQYVACDAFTFALASAASDASDLRSLQRGLFRGLERGLI